MSSPPLPKAQSIAIVGMACIFPGAHSPEALWENILSGRRYFRKIPNCRLPQQYYYDPDPDASGKTYCHQAALITDWTFDPLKFRLAPVKVRASDLTHWLALDTAERAVADTGLKPETMNTDRIGCILGNSLGGEFGRSHNLRFRSPYLRKVLEDVLIISDADRDEFNTLIDIVEKRFNAPFPEITEDTLAGNMSNTIVGRICNYFNLGGGGYTIDGACSSSLLAVSHAANALISGEMDMVLAGGVDISLDPFEIVGFAKAKALSPDDIKVYDAHANGMLPGEGCGIAVLMREDDARKKGFRIRALIRGWGYSTDGRGGITAPDADGQARALQAAYRKAGYGISTVGLLEGHGTGTTLGDQVELAAIQKVIQQEKQLSGPLLIGSIKGNIGHCKAAAGIAGLIKVVMALENKMLPPTTNCVLPNKHFDQALKPMLRGRVWSKGDNPRRASVSAMGFGGSNAHVTLEEASQDPSIFSTNQPLLASSQATELILCSGNTPEEIKVFVEKLLRVADKISRAELVDLSAELCRLKPKGNYRLALLVNSPWDLVKKLQKIREALLKNIPLSAVHDPVSGVFAGETRKDPKCIFLFPGQGSQHLNMGVDLLHRFPELQSLHASLDLPFSLDSYFLKDTIGETATCIENWKSQLTQTNIAQPSITFVSLAFDWLLKAWNLLPAACIGHSLGELAALAASGAVSAPTAVNISALRGQEMQNIHCADSGKMAAVFDTPENVERMVSRFGGHVQIANYNAPDQVVISGKSIFIEQAAEIFKAQQIRYTILPVSHAFHSPIVAPVANSFAKKLERFEFSTLSTAMISTATAGFIKQDEDLLTYLSDQIIQPVRFQQAVNFAGSEIQPDLWVEIGPGTILTNLLRSAFGSQKIACYATGESGQDNFVALNRIFGAAYVLGFPLHTEKLFEHRFYRPFSLDTYDPIFITNPCEREVPATRWHGKDLLSELKPTEDDALWRQYIQKRGSFLKSVIQLDLQDYKQQHGYPIPQENGRRSVSSPDSSTSEETTTEKQEPLLTMAKNWIAGRTGFPLVAIDSHMKLRDDLNLDSIKTGELILVLKEHLGIDTYIDPSFYANQALGELIQGLERSATNSKDAILSTDTPTISSEHTSTWVDAFPMQWLPHPIDRHKSSEVNQVEQRLGICAPFGMAHLSGLISELKILGFRTFTIDEDFQNLDKLENLAGVLLLLPETSSPFTEWNPKKYSRFLEKQARVIFGFFKALSKLVPIQAAKCMILSLQSHQGHQEDGAGYAALKSFLLEQPKWAGKWLQLPANISHSQLAGHIAEEWISFGRFQFIRYTDDGERLAWIAGLSNHGSSLQADNFFSGSPAQQPQTVLVTGGGKGITFELAHHLAKTFPSVQLALVGRSPIPDIDDMSSELGSNLRKLQLDGLRYRYYSCDITSMEAVGTTIAMIQNELGPITGILHGAGVSNLSPIGRKTWEEYWTCIEVKALGLYNVLSALPLDKLDFLHFISSIIGKTGMPGQLDYAFANAWLDGVAERFSRQYPNIHVLSLGYSLWSGVGLGEKLGVVAQLKSAGMTTIDMEQGTEIYCELLQKDRRFSNYFITGRLRPELENGIFSTPTATKSRYLQNITRWIPGRLVIAEAEISHLEDWHLAEHVFDGSPLFPGVIALDAMVGAVQCLANSPDLPAIRKLNFFKPLIVLHESSVKILIEAEQTVGKSASLFKTKIFSASSSSREVFFEAEMDFGEISKLPDEVLPGLGTPLPIDPESFAPDPLFQGKLFRRISAVYKLVEGSECIAEIQVPKAPQYFGSPALHATSTIPAIQDAFLQVGLLVLPPGSLPVRIGSVHFHQLPAEGEKVICWVRVHQYSDSDCLASLWVFNEHGTLLESMLNVETKTPDRRGAQDKKQRILRPGRLDQVREEWDALTEDRKTAVCLLDHERDLGRGKPAGSEKQAPNQIAGQLAAVSMADKCATRFVGDEQIQILHASTGAPLLQVTHNPEVNWCISLSDSTHYSLALLSQSPCGTDLEKVVSRSAEQWMGLLGASSYRMALELHRRIGESFDCTASRIWTIREAVFKITNSPSGDLAPAFESSLGGSWLCFSVPTMAIKIDVYSTIAQDEQDQYAVCFAITA